MQQRWSNEQSGGINSNFNDEGCGGVTHTRDQVTQRLDSGAAGSAGDTQKACLCTARCQMHYAAEVGVWLKRLISVRHAISCKRHYGDRGQKVNEEVSSNAVLLIDIRADT